MSRTSVQYHGLTTYHRHRMTGHYLDWENQPKAFKDYPGIQPAPLAPDVPMPDQKLSSLVKDRDKNEAAKVIDKEDLSLILHLTCSLTAKARYAGGDFYFRSVASAGALYPTEIYVATHAVHGLEEGLYHFAVHHDALFPLRTQKLSKSIAGAIPLPESKGPIMTFFLTAIFFRSAWKYRDRSYRYDLLDTGHLVENLTLALKVLRLPFALHYDFDDRRINHLLGLDETKEVTLVAANVFRDDPISDIGEEDTAELPEHVRRASRVAGKEIEYPIIREHHEAGMSVVPSRGKAPEIIHELGLKAPRWESTVSPPAWPEVMNYTDALSHRRSRRNFVKKPLPRDGLMALLDCLCMKDDVDPARETGWQRALCTGFIAGDVMDTPPGLYLLDKAKATMGLVASGSLTEKMSSVCLDQGWLANAAVHFVFLTNLEVLDRIWGPRGYRYAMIEAGRLGERLYIVATALDMGCCGIGAFYDGEAADLLGLNKDSKLLYLVAVGPVKEMKRR